MKFKGINWFLGCLAVLTLFSFQELKLKKRITDKEFRYEFYVTDKEPEIKSERTYYWFKAGAIHNSEYGISGELLDGAFEKFYLNNQLAEKGEFDRGLRKGVWKTWHQNGVIKTNQYWDEGRKKGMSFLYDEQGVLIEKGRFRSDKKHGKWINFITKDTVEYNNGEKVIPKPKKKKDAKESVEGEKKPSFFKRLFSKKKKSNDEAKLNTKSDSKPNQKGAKTKENKKEKASDNKKPNTKKDSFFKRLFSKKANTNDKSQ